MFKKHYLHSKTILISGKNFPEKKLTLLGIAVIFFGAAFLVYHAFHGMGTPDESFYLSIPYRLLLGDKLFIDEWHVAQTSAFLQYLPVKLFVKLTGGTDGIVLFFRLLFCVCQSAVALFIFFKMKSYGFWSAVSGALFFQLCVPELVESLDYYTLSLMPLTLLVFSLIFSEKPHKLRLVFSGILFAVSVAAEPVFALLYFAYTVTVFIRIIRKKQNIALLTAASWLFITIGILLVFFAFMLFILSQESLAEFIKNIPNIFNSTEYSLSTLFGHGNAVAALMDKQKILFFLSLIWLICVSIDKNRKSRQLIWAAAGTGIFIIYAVVFAWQIVSCNNIAAVLWIPYISAAYALGILILANKKSRELFGIWLAGFLYFLFLGITSEAMDYVGAIGFSVSSISLVPGIFNLFHEIKNNKKSRVFGSSISPKTLKKINKSFFSLACAVPVVLILSMSFVLFIGDTSAAAVKNKFVSADTMIQTGPLRGIKVTSSVSDTYDSMLRDIEKMEQDDNGKITVAALNPLLLLASDRANATYTTWYLNEHIETFRRYFSSTGITPSYIYIPCFHIHLTDTPEKNNAETALEFFSSFFDVNCTNGEAGYILKVNGVRN